jgi:hypothetical protein
MLAWQPTRDLTQGEFKNGVLVVAIGLGVSFFLAGMVALPPLAACLLYLAATLTMAAVGSPDWLSQVLRRAPTRGDRPTNDLAARAFLVTGALTASTFGIWALLR